MDTQISSRTLDTMNLKRQYQFLQVALHRFQTPRSHIGHPALRQNLSSTSKVWAKQFFPSHQSSLGLLVCQWGPWMEVSIVLLRWRRPKGMIINLSSQACCYGNQEHVGSIRNACSWRNIHIEPWESVWIPSSTPSCLYFFFQLPPKLWKPNVKHLKRTLSCMSRIHHGE